MTCAKYPIGALRHVVDIQAKTRIADGQGGFTASWGTVAGSATRANGILCAGHSNPIWSSRRYGPSMAFDAAGISHPSRPNTIVGTATAAT